MTSGTQMTWPSMAEFQEAVQSPSLCFNDGDLKGGEPVVNALGLPRPICGQFASVYEVESGRHFAVKCFLRNIPDQHERYNKISQHLQSLKTDYFVTFEYQAEGIKVRGRGYPLVKMEWVEAVGLNAYILENLNNPNALRELEKRWLELLDDLKKMGVGHGDLQHGNVLVQADGSLRLIDYDGMFVPSLAGETSHEIGHPDYQSPKRTEKDFNADVDRFAGLIIRMAIRALSIEPDLWDKYDNGDNLLFKRQDYLKPAKSKLMVELRKLGDPDIDAGLDELFGSFKSDVETPKKTREAKPQAPQKTQPAKTRAVETQPAKKTQPAPAPQEKPKKSKKKLRGKRAKTRAALGRKSNAAPGSAPSWMQDHGATTAPATSRIKKPAASSGTQSAPASTGQGQSSQPSKQSPQKTGTRAATPTPAPQPALTPAPQPAPQPVKQPAPPPAKQPASKPAAVGPAQPPSTATKVFWSFLHMLALVPMLVKEVAVWLSFPDSGEPVASLPDWCFNVALGLGCVSLFTLAVLPKLHRVTRLWFFGYLLPLLLLNLISVVMNAPKTIDGLGWTARCSATGTLILVSLWVVIFGRKKKASP